MRDRDRDINTDRDRTWLHTYWCKTVPDLDKKLLWCLATDSHTGLFLWDQSLHYTEDNAAIRSGLNKPGHRDTRCSI